ncbi:choice-of-anchor P family protein [Actinokineospora spheciospongiae]|uniref:choice-of-anchor P family protein n=1 Tax=Actinokineospora spheciospongiae TaxID=909613 RepID=UPI000D7153A4|nr:choice-of-anchor P family protein [Actinokineospora spheciospongiae]PWW54877.1 LPXTG-motif cell wall-anchored protein [Actinokineospora spheciospongiae]
MRPPRLFALSAAVAGTAALTALTAPFAAATGGPTGSAFAVSVQAKALNAASVSVGPAPLATYPAGDDKSVVKVDLAKAGVVAKVVNASSDLTGSKLVSTASIAEVDVLGILKAKIVEATCTSDGKTVTGKSTLAEVTLMGHKVDVSARGKVDVAGLATVSVDEQITGADGSLTVNALHVSFGGQLKNLAQGDIILSQAKCGKTTGGGDGGPSTTAPNAGGGDKDVETPSNPTSSPVATTPGSGSGSDSGSGSGDNGGVTPVANEDDLANTGATGILPLAIGGVALVGGGAGAFWYARRKRTA